MCADMVTIVVIILIILVLLMAAVVCASRMGCSLKILKIPHASRHDSFTRAAAARSAKGGGGRNSDAPALELTDALLAEYTQWRLTREILRILEAYREAAAHEKQAALERYLMATANMPREPESPGWATIYRRSSGAADTQFRKELGDHSHRRSGGKVAGLFAKIRRAIDDAFKGAGAWAPARVRAEAEKTPPVCTAELAQVGRYRETAADQALERMISVGGGAATLNALLRYAALGAYSSSWGVPFEAARRLYEDFGVKYEGFASPLNSRLMTFEGTAFCSLFEDTDAAFGSIGSFFEAGRTVGGEGAWMVNPPYTEKLLAAAAAIVLERAAAEPEYEAYFMCPRWTDSEAYSRMARSPHLVAMQETTKRGVFRSEDSQGVQKTGAPTAFFAIAGTATPARRARMVRGMAAIFRAGASRAAPQK